MNKEEMLKSQIIKKLIKFNVSSLISTIDSQLKIQQYSSFLQIMNYSNSKKSLVIKSESIYYYLNIILKRLIKVRAFTEKSVLIKKFTKWKNYSKITSKTNQLIKETESKVKIKIDQEYNNLLATTTQKQKAVDELKRKVEKEKKNVLEKEELQAKILKRENELQESINLIENERNDLIAKLSTYKENQLEDNKNIILLLKEKIHIKEQEFKQLNNEFEEKNNTISIFINQMNEMCLAHEQACKIK